MVLHWAVSCAVLFWFNLSRVWYHWRVDDTGSWKFSNTEFSKELNETKWLKFSLRNVNFPLNTLYSNFWEFFYLNSVSSQLIDAINNNNNAAIITVAYTSWSQTLSFHFVLPESSFCQFDPWEEKLAGDWTYSPVLSLSSSSQSSSTDETELIVRLRFLYLRSYASGRGCMLTAFGKRCSRPPSP